MSEDEEMAEFVKARLGEDEQSADQRHHRDCESLPDVLYPGRDTGACDCGTPDQVLAGIEADRALLKEYEESEAALAAAPDMWDVGRVEGLRVALQLRTARFAGHPDYRAEWCP
ncbi:DUF6221 family protein [Streptomyces tricolor]